MSIEYAQHDDEGSCFECNGCSKQRSKAITSQIFEDVEKYSKEEDYHVPELLKFLKAKYLAEKSE